MASGVFAIAGGSRVRFVRSFFAGRSGHPAGSQRCFACLVLQGLFFNWTQQLQAMSSAQLQSLPAQPPCLESNWIPLWIPPHRNMLQPIDFCQA
jgi:hypothetical protein